jgi:hypothetical protein
MENKIIQVDFNSKKSKNSKKIIQEKQKKKRIITDTAKWNKMNIENDIPDIEILENILSRSILNQNILSQETSTTENLIIQLINRKIYSYKFQDLEKNKYNDQETIDLKTVIQKLIKCNMKCFYCLEPVQLLYEYVREPKQWTVERIDNALGHNKDNTEIACLSCNLRRRTMFHERYIFTKQVNIVRIMDTI